MDKILTAIRWLTFVFAVGMLIHLKHMMPYELLSLRHMVCYIIILVDYVWWVRIENMRD